MENEQTSGVTDDDIDPIEMRIWIEFGAWCAFVMAPLIWWLQGPSVSTDQFVVRTGLVVISFVVGLGMRIWAIRSPFSVADIKSKEPSTLAATDQPKN